MLRFTCLFAGLFVLPSRSEVALPTAKILREPERIDQYNEQRLLLADFKKLSTKIMGDKFFPLEESYNYLIKEFEVPVSEEEKELLEKLKPELSSFQQALVQAEETLTRKQEEFQRQTESMRPLRCLWCGVMLCSHSRVLAVAL